MNIIITEYHNTSSYDIYDNNSNFILSIIGTSHAHNINNQTFEIYHNKNRIVCLTSVLNVE